jgi:phosphotransferase system  glucose/maltose/N-acetylglucosamine-specific IIC component
VALHAALALLGSGCTIMSKAEIGVPVTAGILFIIGLAANHGTWWQYVSVAAFFLIVLPYCAITLERLRADKEAPAEHEDGDNERGQLRSTRPEESRR